MINESINRELELKMSTVVSVDTFLAVIAEHWFRTKPDSYYSGFDFYLSNKEGEVIRFRTDQKEWKELTVKKRLQTDGKYETADRLEVDLFVRSGESDSKVLNLLHALGFSDDVAVYKEAIVLHVTLDSEFGIDGVVSWYQVSDASSGLTDPRNKCFSFIEVEVDKSMSLHPKTTEVLFRTRERLQGLFGELPIVDLGVYEIFSGKRYKVAEGHV